MTQISERDPHPTQPQQVSTLDVAENISCPIYNCINRKSITYIYLVERIQVGTYILLSSEKNITIEVDQIGLQHLSWIRQFGIRNGT